MIYLCWLLSGLAWSTMRHPMKRPEAVVWEPGLQRDVLVIKLEERFSGQLEGWTGDLADGC